MEAEAEAMPPQPGAPRTARVTSSQQSSCNRPSSEPVEVNQPCDPQSWTSGLQNSDRINASCFKTPSLWRFVTTASGKQDPAFLWTHLTSQLIS